MPYLIRVQTGLALILTAVAGYIDALGFLTLGEVYVANMSGNSITAGISLAQRDARPTLERLWTIAAFFAGLLLCRILMEAIAARRRPVRVYIPLCCELALLLLFALGHAVRGVPQEVLVFLVASAMGFQNATITYFGRFRIYTGFVTGTLTKLAIRLGAWIVWAARKLRRLSWARIQRVAAVSLRRRPAKDIVWLASIWSMYLAGAAGGTLALHRWHGSAVAMPCAALAVVIAGDLAGRLSRSA